MNKKIMSIAAILFLAACTKENPDNNGNNNNNNTQNDSIQFVFVNEYNGAALELDANKLNYSTTKTTGFSLGLFKYYVSRIALKKKDNSSVDFDVFKLIDEAKADSRTLTQKGAQGEYDSMIFFLGIPKDRNHSGAQDGDLDPSKGMIWTWNTGYVFFKHEGKFKDSTGATKVLTQHLGTDAALVRVALPLSAMKMEGKKKKVTISLDIRKIYDAAEVIDFNEDFNRQSTDPKDAIWMSKITTNFPAAFAVKSIE